MPVTDQTRQAAREPGALTATSWGAVAGRGGWALVHLVVRLDKPGSVVRPTLWRLQKLGALPSGERLPGAPVNVAGVSLGLVRQPVGSACCSPAWRAAAARSVQFDIWTSGALLSRVVLY